MFKDSAFEFPSVSNEEIAASVLLSAKRNKRRSSVDLLDASFSGTPLFSPNGTSHESFHPRLPPPPDITPPVLLAPAPKGRRADRIPKQKEDFEPDDLEVIEEAPSPPDEAALDVDDDEYKPSVKTDKSRRPPVGNSPASQHAHSKAPNYSQDDDEDDGNKKHKRPAMKRDGDPTPETKDDMLRREGHVCQALQVSNMDELFSLFTPNECFMVTVYPCKDPACNNRRKTCVHRVNRFQSTRNSKRHVHAFLYYKLAKGIHTLVPDDTIRLLWKWLESTCNNGLKNANGHGKANDGRICVNPYHYRLTSRLDIDALKDS
jgi:hypothetical protein